MIIEAVFFQQAPVKSQLSTPSTPSIVLPSALRTLGQDTLTIFWGDWLELRSRLTQVAATGLVSPLIYILAFGLGLGSAVDRAMEPPMGANYLEFILPGMVALSSMTISFAGTTFSICGDRLYSKTFEELMMMPVHPLALHLGKTLSGIVRGVMTASSVLLIAILFTGNVWGFLNPLFLTVLVLNCAVFAGLGVIVGLGVASLESVGLLNNFLIVPMSFLGATFFDPATLPVVLKVVVYCLPLTYATTAMRAAVYDPAQFPWFSIPVLLVCAIVLSLIGARKFATQRD